MIDIIKYLVVPSNLIAIFLIAGLVFLLFRRTRQTAIYLLVLGAFVYIAFGIGPVSYWLLGKLEHRYPALNSFENLDKIDTLVVLSGHAEPDPYFPISSKVSSSTAFRLIEALRLWRLFPNAKILIPGHTDVPVIMKEFLTALGVPDDRITIECKSKNTYENALNIQERIGNGSFILITSAGHMPRAMALFRKLGMNPIPAPTDYQTGKNCWAARYLPTPQHLNYSDTAVHEYIALLWYRLRDRI